MPSCASLRPSVFIGSSVEGLDVAYAFQESLEHEAEVTVWPQGLFEPSRTTIESLDAQLNSFDFAVFVFGPDDVIKIRNQQMSSVRDNVILELGMAIGRLGRERAFILMPRQDTPLHLPTDLLGVTPVTFNPSRSDGNLVAAVGPASNQVRRAMKKLGNARQSGEASAGTDPIALGLSQELRQELFTFNTSPNQLK